MGGHASQGPMVSRKLCQGGNPAGSISAFLPCGDIRTASLPQPRPVAPPSRNLIKFTPTRKLARFPQTLRVTLMPNFIGPYEGGLEFQQTLHRGRKSFPSDAFFFFFFFFWLYPQPMEVPRPGIEPTPKQSSAPLQRQPWILNPPSHQGTPVQEILDDHSLLT